MRGMYDGPLLIPTQRARRAYIISLLAISMHKISSEYFSMRNVEVMPAMLSDALLSD